ncbi:MAG: ATP-binding cassette domain-containing protein [Gemmatimonadetes bacterium]|nr:ATP-binding cassette domain-containing protein [Gemmatimonadota bacterium]
MKDAPLLEARGVGRRASGDEGWLLRDVSLTLAAGERLAVVGPSGAGKSLLLRSLALLDPVDRGEILWRGERVADDDVPAFRRDLVYLHQRPALFEGTVVDNLRRPLSLSACGGRGWDRQRILGWLDPLGRDAAFLDKRSTDLSGGEAQIAAFLRAIQLDPRGLLLDEPTAALDATAAAALETLVDRWFGERAGERALVWVSHDAGQAERASDRIVRLEAGRIAA